MPAILSDVAPNARPIFVPRLLSERPQLAALVAETISTWSYAEHGLGRSVATMSRGINSAEMEAYSASGFRDRLKIVRRIARTELHDPYLTLFLKVLGIISSLGHRRHAFAHDIWGTVEALPADLLLVEPRYLFRHWGAANDWLAAFSGGGAGAAGPIDSLDNRHIEVWSEMDLKEEIARMNQAYELALALEMLASVDTFDASNARRTHAQNWLLRHPLVSSTPS
jgi:hypothetical protein